MKILPLLAALLYAGISNAGILVEEHFATTQDITNGIPGWTPIARFMNAQAKGVSDSGELLTGGLNHGPISKGINGLKNKAQDGYACNESLTDGCRYYRPLDKPINFTEGSTLYFSALVKGAKRVNFGLGNMGKGFSPKSLLSIGANPQLFPDQKEANMPESFNASVWLGRLDTMQKGDGNQITVGKKPVDSIRLIVGRMVNNIGPNDEISYHIGALGNVNMPQTWVGEKIPRSTKFYSKTDFDFGGDLLFNSLFINLQNNSGLDEIYFGTSYEDVIGQAEGSAPAPSSSIGSWQTSGKGWQIKDAQTVLCTVLAGDAPELRGCAQSIKGARVGSATSLSLDVKCSTTSHPSSKAQVLIVFLDEDGGIIKEAATDVGTAQQNVRIDNVPAPEGATETYAIFTVNIPKMATGSDTWEISNFTTSIH